VIALVCLVTQWVELILTMVQHDAKTIEQDTLSLLNKILTTLSATVLSIYSGYYSWRLMKALGQTSFKKKLRAKVVLQALTIQLVLLLHTAYAWVRVQNRTDDWHDRPWLWPSF